MPAFIPLTLWLEKIPGKGEDASPLVRQYGDGSGVVMVFDGLGGSGSTQYDWEGEHFTGAWFGSRVAKALFAAWLPWAKSKNDFQPATAVKDYSASLTTLLAHALKQLDKNPSKLRSSMIRPLPSTLSGIYFESQAKGFRCCAWNAGDSRAYVWRPEPGLQQVTRDDIVIPADALATLISSTKIANCLAADGKFTLHSYEFEVEGPVVFVAASDGCFDYVPFPAHFEFMLLDHLMLSENPGEWAKRLGSAFRAIAGDDVSLAVAACGWEDFSAFKSAFRQRYSYLNETFASPVEAMEAEIRATEADNPALMEKRDSLRAELWQKYRVSYEQYLNKINRP